MTLSWIEPDWPAPCRVRALSTTRRGGVSAGPFLSLNLGDHVGDDPSAVAENRRRLAVVAGLPCEPAWLRQVHGVNVVTLAPGTAGGAADAAIAREPGVVCAVLTADCLPVLFTNRQGSAVAAAHAGWRGLADGILEAVIEHMGEAPSELLAWIGPGIGPAVFEVGPEVREHFVAADSRSADHFQPGTGDRYFADLPQLARQRLSRVGVATVYGGDRCTFDETENFFSHRRDGRCGRMASLIWLSGTPSR